MAVTLKLVKTSDFIADIDYIDLLSGGYSLAANGYAPVVAPIGAKSVHETITLNLKGTSTDDLALLVQALNLKIKQVQWWMENPAVEQYQVWLRCQMDEESEVRQAQILNILPPDKVNIFTDRETADHHIADYIFGIERAPFWESPYPYPTTTAMPNVNIIGGSAVLSETIIGDVPARLARLTAALDASSGYVSEFWAGWKSSRLGTVANFVPIWSLVDGAPVDTDTSEVADATTYAGTGKVQTSFATDATLILRDRILLINAVPTNLADQRGSYTVLLRAKMSDTSVARLRMIAGLYSGGTFQAPVYRNRQRISGTAWSFYELGNVKIPPSRLPSGYNFENFGIGIYAERISGAGALDMDCLVFIPVDDSAVKLASSDSLNNSGSLEVFGAADGTLYSTALHASGKSIFTVVPEPQGEWSVPSNADSPRLIIAANDSAVGTATGCVKGKTLDLSYVFIPRWRTLRGADSIPAGPIVT